MTYKINGVVLLAGLAALLSGCAIMNPPPPSRGPNQFVVIVRGEQGPVNAFRDYVEPRLQSRSPRDCDRKVPSSTGESPGATSGLIGEQLVYECAAQTRAQSGSLLEIFATAYGNSIASLLEMKITTSGACVARSCYGGPLRYWQQTPPCMYVC
ncbi:MAG TPA: hypothetical protein VGK75_16240 [Casimicrobiaceae bacterium]|jgi:hypothetical protein